MKKVALVTGSPDRVEGVASALAEAGYEVRKAARLERSDGVEADSIDCYVQLPSLVDARGDSTVERVCAFLSDGLLARFTAAGAVLPGLREGAVVLLVGGNRPTYEASPDAQYARTSLLNVLAAAIRADTGHRTVRVETMGPEDDSSAIAKVASQGLRSPTTVDLVEYGADLDYDEWRLAVLSMARVEA